MSPHYHGNHRKSLRNHGRIQQPRKLSRKHTGNCSPPCPAPSPLLRATPLPFQSHPRGYDNRASPLRVLLTAPRSREQHRPISAARRPQPMGDAAWSHVAGAGLQRSIYMEFCLPRPRLYRVGLVVLYVGSPHHQYLPTVSPIPQCLYRAPIPPCLYRATPSPANPNVHIGLLSPVFT